MFLLRSAAVALLLIGLTACNATIPKSLQENAYKATSVAFTAWESVLVAADKYGDLRPCTDADKIKLLCREPSAWAKIQSITHRTTAALNVLKPAILAGDSKIDLLLSVPQIVYDAQVEIYAVQTGKEVP